MMKVTRCRTIIYAHELRSFVILICHMNRDGGGKKVSIFVHYQKLGEHLHLNQLKKNKAK